MKLPDPVHTNVVVDEQWHEKTRVYWVSGATGDVLIQIGEGHQPQQDQLPRFWTIYVWTDRGFEECFHLDRDNGASWDDVERLVDCVPGVFESMHQKRLNS
jgi:hypothetical protein